MITHKQVLEQMRKGQPFSITFRTLNKQKKKGGKLIEVHTAKLITGKVDAAHRKNHTFNIKVMADGHEIGNPITVHLPLVLFFNGESCTP